MDSFSGGVNLAIISHGIASSQNPSPRLLCPATAQLLTTTASTGASVLGPQHLGVCWLKMNLQNYKATVNIISPKWKNNYFSSTLKQKRHWQAKALT